VVGAFVGLLMLVAPMLAGPTPGDETYEVRRHVLLAMEGTLPVEDEHGRVVAAYKINPNIWEAGELPVEVRFNAANSPSEHDPETLLKNAISEWSSVEGSYFTFEWGGGSLSDASTCGSPFKADGVNTVTFVTTRSPVTLGITCTVWRPNAGPNAPLLEFDMQLNANINWGSGSTIAPGEYDLASTILHELGHAAGLAHSCTAFCTGTEEAAVMYRALSSQVQKRTLRSDDITALTEAYPLADVTPTPSPTPQPTATPTVPTSTGFGFNIRAPGIARD
jgi:hypothetical protein